MDDVHNLSRIDRFFLSKLRNIAMMKKVYINYVVTRCFDALLSSLLPVFLAAVAVLVYYDIGHLIMG